MLAVIPAVILAVSGRYPQRIFDLVMGLNRWCYRVLAYVALMRNEYPCPAFQVSGRFLWDALEWGMTTYREVVMAATST